MYIYPVCNLEMVHGYTLVLEYSIQVTNLEWSPKRNSKP